MLRWKGSEEGLSGVGRRKTSLMMRSRIWRGIADAGYRRREGEGVEALANPRRSHGLFLEREGQKRRRTRRRLVFRPILFERNDAHSLRKSLNQAKRKGRSKMVSSSVETMKKEMGAQLTSAASKVFRLSMADMI